jgi:hypothetical protein
LEFLFDYNNNTVNCHFIKSKHKGENGQFFFYSGLETMVLKKSFEHLKHFERRSQQTRHHRTHLNQICDQKLHEKLNNLANEFEETFNHLKTHKKLEQQRKQTLGMTVQQIVHERQRHSLSTNLENHSLSSIKQTPLRTSCRLFSQNCQLYPCQPIYHYTSFIKKEHDQTLKYGNPSHLPNLISNHQQLEIKSHDQHHLANRYVSIARKVSLLNEQSRLLHERLADKKSFGYIKEDQYKLRQAIQRHLKISAKFCV